MAHLRDPREDRRADCRILLDLNNANFIFPAFRLNRQYIMNAAFINADINFVSFHLPHVGNRSSQMILERVTRQPSENIDKSVVPNLCQNSLLIIQGISRDDPRGGIGYFCLCHPAGRRNNGLLHKSQFIF